MSIHSKGKNKNRIKHNDFEEPEGDDLVSTQNVYDISDILRKRVDRVKDLRLKEHRRRKWKNRDAA